MTKIKFVLLNLTLKSQLEEYFSLSHLILYSGWCQIYSFCCPWSGFFLCENIEDLFVDCVLPTFIGNSLVVTIQDNLTIL